MPSRRGPNGEPRTEEEIIAALRETESRGLQAAARRRPPPVDAPIKSPPVPINRIQYRPPPAPVNDAGRPLPAGPENPAETAATRPKKGVPLKIRESLARTAVPVTPPERNAGIDAPAAEVAARGEIDSPPSTVVRPAENAAAVVKPSPDSDERLSEEERKLLNECESDIRLNLQAPFVLGFRLWQIKEMRLYHNSHRTFESYSTEMWDFSKSHANRLIQAYLCLENLKTVGRARKIHLPTAESHVRCIVDLKPDEQAEVAAEVLAVVGDRRATGKSFLAAREKLYPKPKRKAESIKPANDAARDEPPETEVVMPIKFDTNLVPFGELKKWATDIYNIYDNPTKRQQALNLVARLKGQLGLWENWQAEQLNGKCNPAGITSGPQKTDEMKLDEKTTHREQPNG
jgi:hypothetical protein